MLESSSIHQCQCQNLPARSEAVIYAKIYLLLKYRLYIVMTFIIITFPMSKHVFVECRLSIYIHIMYYAAQRYIYTRLIVG